MKNIIVLRRDPYELKITLEKRGYSENKVYENLEAEILDVCLWGAIKKYGTEKVCEINTTRLTVEKIVEEIILVLNKKRNCIVGVVDWLTKLDNEGTLKNFLKI